MQFIDQSLPKVLPDSRRSTSDPDIFSVGSITSSFKCDVNPFRNEMKCRASLHYKGRTRIMCQHENLRMENRGLTPPPSPALISPSAAYRPEHISAHNPGPNIVEAASGKVVVDPGLTVILAKEVRLYRPGRKKPFMQDGSTDSKRILKALVRARAKAVNRNGKTFHPDFSHLLNNVRLGLLAYSGRTLRCPTRCRAV